MGDRARVGRLIALGSTDGTALGLDGPRDGGPAYQITDLVYQLWGHPIDLSHLGPIEERAIDLMPNFRARLAIAACGHMLEVQDGKNTLCEVVAALVCDPLLLPLVERPLGDARREGIAIRKDVSGMGVRTAMRIVDFTPGRARWLATLAHDPALTSRVLVATLPSGDPHIVMASPPASARVTAAYVVLATSKMVLTESSFVRC